MAPTCARPAVRGWVVASVTIPAFVVLETFDWTLFHALAEETRGWERVGALALFRYLPWLLGPLILAALLFGPARAPGALGLNRPVAPALLFGLGVTAPLAIGLALLLPFAPRADWATGIVRFAILPGLFEEIFYRAFLFGLLFRFAGWGFLPAALLGAAFFGAAHLAGGDDPLEAAGIFALTGLGALWFAWLYAEWGWNIWVPAGVHILMNLWWDLFQPADSAAGTWAVNGLRLLVVLLSVALTLIRARRHGGRDIRGRRWLGGPGGAATPACASP